MENGCPYVKDSSDFKNKIKKLGRLFRNNTLVTADVVALYPSIPHEDGLETLRERPVKSEDLKLLVIDIVKMTEFVLKNNIFEFDKKVKQQVAGTAIGTKFATPYACIYLDEVETEFLKMQELQRLVWLQYIDDIFFTWNHSEDELTKFLENLNKFKSNLKFRYEIPKDNINFLNLNVSMKESNLVNYLYFKETDRH